ncbi:MAG: extracellular solute-binding protein [Rhizobiaceae bacterium]|nr:extracellular solute-binding protein [Rhizobiaceae bacterium]
MFRKALILLPALAGLMCASAARADDAALVDAAKKEGSVTWYTTLVVDQVVQAIIEGFEKKYGIQVNFVSAPWEETAFRIINEGKASATKSDVFDSLPAYAAVHAAGLIQPFAPDAAKDYDPAYKDPAGYWTASIIQPLSPAINTDMVSATDAPHTYEDLLDPKWKGKMAWTNSASIGGPPGFIAAVLDSMGEQKGMDYLHKLAGQQIANIPSNPRVVLDRAVSGENPLVLSIYNYHAAISKNQGAPVEWIKMEPLVAHVGLVAMTKGAPHPNAGKLLIDYILSDDGAKVMAKAGYIPTNKSAQSSVADLVPGENYKIFLVTPDIYEKKIKDWVKIYDDLFSK